MKFSDYRFPAAIAVFGLIVGSWGAFAASVHVTRAKPAALSICVQPEGSVSSGALSKVSIAAGALPESHARERTKAALSGALEDTVVLLPPRVSSGCPDGFVQPDADRLKLRVSVKATPVATVPPHNIYVFVVRADSGVVPPDTAYLRLPYEMNCLEHVCAEISTALYIRESALGDEALTLRALEEAAGYATLSTFPEGRPTN